MKEEWLRREGGLSEIVSSLTLIIVLVIAAGVILSFTTAQFPKETLPYADILYEEIVNDPTSVENYAIFHHKGGDNFPYGSLRIRAYDQDGVFQEEYASDDLILVKPDETETSWLSSNIPLSFGHGLKTPDFVGSDHSYQVIYKQGAGDYVYRQYGEGFSGVIAPSPTPIPGFDCSGLDPEFTSSLSGLTLSLSPNYPGDDSSHIWIISGADFHKVFSTKEPVLTLPCISSGSTQQYTVFHQIIKTQVIDGITSPVCIASDTENIDLDCSSDPCSCCPPCKMDFSYRKVGTKFYFFDKSDGANKWSWSFGDGHTSSETNPNHEFTGASSFLVTLSGAHRDAICNRVTPCRSASKQVMIGCPGDGSFNVRYDRSDPSIGPVFIHWDPDSVFAGQSYTLSWDFGTNVPDETNYNQGDWPSNSVKNFPYTGRCGDFSITLRAITSCGIQESVKTLSIPCICNNPPVADFSWEKTSTSPFEIDITDLSSHPLGREIIKWIWDISDGTQYTHETSPGTFSHRFPSPGQYSIHLKVIDADNCEDTTHRIISSGGDSCIPGTPEADFSFRQDDGNKRLFHFTDLSEPSGSIVRWKWTFGDDGYSNDPTPSHLYTDTRMKYTVRLDVWDEDGCNDYAVQDLTIPCLNPRAEFSITPDDSNPNRFTIEESSDIPPGHTATYNWEFGDGRTSDLQNPTPIEYSICGQYTVRLKVTTDCGSWDQTHRDAICGCPNPDPKFDYSCIGPTTVRFSDISHIPGGTAEYLWSFGDGDSSTEQNPEHTYLNPGTYSVSLTLSTSCGSSASWTKEVTVPCCQMPTSDFTYTCKPDGRTITFSDTSKTDGDTITEYLWEFESGFTSDQPNPEHTFSGDGTFPVRLTVTTACGASNTFTQDIRTPCFCSPPIAFFRTETISTDPFTIRITDLPDDDSITNWNWSFGDGTSFPGKTPPNHQYPGCGEHLITLRVTNDCGATDEYKQLVCCPVYANFTYRMEPQDGTAPVTVYFTDQTIGTPNAWSWFFGDGGFSSFRNPVHTYTKGGNFSVTLHATSPCGGNETHSKPIRIGCPPVTAQFNYTIIQEDPLTVKFTDLSTGEDITEWNWYFGDGSSSTEQNPVHIYRIRDDYQVILTIKNSCGSESTNTMYLPIGCLPLNITATAHEGGYITPSGVIQVPCGWNQNFEITPDECHTIKDVILDGIHSLGPITNYTFIDVQIDQTLDAYFEIKNYIVASSADPGGSIDPLGITQVDCGSDQTYTVTADPCFNISNIIINGTEHLGAQESPFTYTFTNILSDQSIHAMFARKTFPITATAGMGGSISPSGILYVPCGFDQTYTITNETCYSIADVIVDGVSVGPVQTYTFTNVTEPHTISSSYSLRGPFTITTSVKSITGTGLVPGGGTVTPSTATVPCGGSETFEITPVNSDYVLADVVVNGVSMGPVNPYTMTNVVENSHLEAIFVQRCRRIIGTVINLTTGMGIGGIQVEAYRNTTGELYGTARSLPSGYYIIPLPINNNQFVDVRCPSGSPVNPGWQTSYSIFDGDQVNGQIRYRIQINPGSSKCEGDVNWYGSHG